MSNQNLIRKNLNHLNSKIEGLCSKFGRDLPVLIAVTKYSSIGEIQMAYDEGQRDFGENKIQDLLVKANHFADLGISDIRWHFIGNIQSNKIKSLMECPNLFAIHSVASLKYLKKINDEAKTIVNTFFQVNITGEESKGGLKSKKEVSDLTDYAKGMTNIKVKGLMGMGPTSKDDFENETKKAFINLVTLRDEVDTSLKLSMGMSSDYEIAIEQGSDFLRIGSSIFR